MPAPVDGCPSLLRAFVLMFNAKTELFRAKLGEIDENQGGWDRPRGHNVGPGGAAGGMLALGSACPGVRHDTARFSVPLC